MKEIPILFSTMMVHALLAGRKTQTRRTSKLNYINTLPESLTFGKCLEAIDMTYSPAPKPGLAAFFGNSDTDVWYAPIYCPYRKPGDLLYVREAWGSFFDEEGQYYGYKADDLGPDFKFKPSIHMPKVAARIWLEVESIRVERLQDISEEDAIAEGVQENVCDEARADTCPSSLCKQDGCCGKGEYYRYPVDFDDEPCYSATESFQSLWESINGGESWNANPWVWVVSFKVLSTTGRPAIAEQEAAAK